MARSCGCLQDRPAALMTCCGSSAGSLAWFASRSGRAEQSVAAESRMKILYVEDNDDNVYVLKHRLEAAGFT